MSERTDCVYSPAPGALLRMMVAAVTCWACGSVARAQQPRYHLPAGRELVYLREVAREAGGATARENQQLTLLVVSRADEHARVLVEFVEVGAAGTGPAWGAVVLVSERGEVELAPEVLALAPPEALAALSDAVVELPGVFVGAGERWRTAADPAGAQWRCGPVAPTEEGVEWRAARIAEAFADAEEMDFGGGGAERGARCVRTVAFSRGAGRVSLVERQEEHAGERVRARTRPYAERQRTGALLERRRESAERLENTLRTANRLRLRLATAPGEAAETLRDLDRAWSELEAGTGRASPVRRIARGYRTRLHRARGDLQARAAQAANWVGRVAAGWSLPDGAGNARRSETVRGAGPCVEIFWRASDPASAALLRRLGEIGSAAPDLAIATINIDADPAAARRLVAALPGERRATHVFAGPPLEGGSPRELPLIRLLDAEARIVAVFFGAPPTLATDLRSILSKRGAE